MWAGFNPEAFAYNILPTLDSFIGLFNPARTDHLTLRDIYKYFLENRGQGSRCATELGIPYEDWIIDFSCQAVMKYARESDGHRIRVLTWVQNHRL